MPHFQPVSPDDWSSLHVLQPGLRWSAQLWRQPDTQPRRGLLQGKRFTAKKLTNLRGILSMIFKLFFKDL